MLGVVMQGKDEFSHGLPVLCLAIYQEFEKRTKSMTLDQFVKIYDKFLDENPELSHHPTGTTSFSLYLI
jgi:hypothetical protein